MGEVGRLLGRLILLGPGGAGFHLWFSRDYLPLPECAGPISQTNALRRRGIGFYAAGMVWVAQEPRACLWPGASQDLCL